MVRKLMRAAFLCGLAAACGTNEANENATASNDGTTNAAAVERRGTIGDALAASLDHSSFMQALQSAGLADTLRGAGPYTVFAPTNAAWEAIPEETRRRLATAEQREQLITLLSYHIVPGTVTAADLGRAVEARGGRAELANVTGDNLGLSRSNGAVLIGDGAGGWAQVTRADQIHANGVVHSIDKVLMPSAN